MKQFKVFIVDASELYALVLDYKLSLKQDYDITIFQTGEECIKNLGNKPDAIILDYTLPGINGLELVKEIRKRKSNIPLAILSMQKDIRVAVDLINAGANTYISKENHALDKIYNFFEKIIKKNRILLNHSVKDMVH